MAESPGVTLAAGRVGRPHGLDGSFYVTRARPLLLEIGSSVTVGGQVATIDRRAGTAERPIVRLSCCEHRDSALALRGEDLLIDAAAAPSLGEGEWWAEEFAGCVVFDGEQRVGVVRKMIGLPSCECLEVEREGGKGELLVPLVTDAIRSIDMPGRRIEINLVFLGEDAAEWK